MQPYAALLIRLVGILAFLRGCLWTVALGRVLYWINDMHTVAAAYAAKGQDGYLTPLSQTRLDQLAENLGVVAPTTVGWIYAAHTFFWLIGGLTAVIFCVPLARLLYTGIRFPMSVESSDSA